MFRRLALGAAVALSFLSVSPVAAQVAFTSIARTGDAAPVPSGATFTGDFYSPCIDAAGQVRFYALVAGAGIDQSNDFGVFTHDAAGLHLWLREADPAPLIDATARLYLPFPFGPIGPDQLVYRSSLVGPGLDHTNNNAFFLQSRGATALIARTGDPAPDMEAETVFQYIGEPVVDRVGHILMDTWLAGPGITAANAQALYAGPVAAPALLARAGDPAPGADGSSFVSMLLPKLGPNGHVAFLANLTGEVSDHYVNLFYGDTTQVQRIIFADTPAPGTDPGVTFRSLDRVSVNALGQIMLATDSALTGPGVGFHNDDGIWAGTPDNLQLVARAGDVAPGTGGKRFNGLYDMELDDELPMFIAPVLGDGGHVAFSARLTDDQGNLLPEWGLWAGLPGNLRRLEPHEVLSVVINALGQLTYFDDLDNDPATGDGGVVFVDPDGGRLVLLQAGQTFDFGNGDVRVLHSWHPGSDPGIFVNESGQFTFEARFTDGSHAVLLGQIPEPASLPVILLSLTALGRRRR